MVTWWLHDSPENEKARSRLKAKDRDTVDGSVDRHLNGQPNGHIPNKKLGSGSVRSHKLHLSDIDADIDAGHKASKLLEIL